MAALALTAGASGPLSSTTRSPVTISQPIAEKGICRSLNSQSPMFFRIYSSIGVVSKSDKGWIREGFSRVGQLIVMTMWLISSRGMPAQ